MIYLVNAFSINMLTVENTDVRFTRISKEEVIEILKPDTWLSAIGHKDMAAMLTNELEVKVYAIRASVNFTYNDQLIIAQYTGPRLPEGCTELPEGAEVKFWSAKHV